MKRVHWVVVVAVVAGMSGVNVWAADKKAESDLRFGLSACQKVKKDMEKKKNAAIRQQENAFKSWQRDLAKFEDQVKKAKAKDASVTKSDTVFDRKTKQTLAQALKECEKLGAEMAQFRAALDKKVAGAKAEKDEKLAAEKKASEKLAAKEKAAFEEKEAKRKAKAAAERAEFEAGNAKRQAKDAAYSAINGYCSSFQGRRGSSGIDQDLKLYEQEKKKALSSFPDIAKEDMKIGLTTAPDATSVDTTKTVGEWFAYCDKVMPAHAKVVKKMEAQAQAKSDAENAARKAADQRIRNEQAAQFQALVAATSGDRKKVLESHGYSPWWPRSGDLKTAPIWKWRIAITHEPTRCETFQFEGDKLTKNFTQLGECP